MRYLDLNAVSYFSVMFHLPKAEILTVFTCVSYWCHYGMVSINQSDTLVEILSFVWCCATFYFV